MTRETWEGAILGAILGSLVIPGVLCGPWTVPGFDYLILIEWFPLKASNKSLAPTPNSGTNSVSFPLNCRKK
mgnify:CR=1 FL=1